jgi:hypothetical protein
MGTKNSFRYRVVWRRVGNGDTFEHCVAASAREEARVESARQVQLALGANAQLWDIVEIAEAETSRLTLALRYPVIL